MKRILSVITCFLFIFNSALLYANEIEKKFIASGLINVSNVDATIKVDLVNSDPKKNFFRENYYNGLGKAYFL